MDEDHDTEISITAGRTTDGDVAIEIGSIVLTMTVEDAKRFGNLVLTAAGSAFHRTSKPAGEPLQ